MSCWVVPTIAAELWGVPVGDVIEQIDAGRLATRTDYGFVLVDVDPSGNGLAPPATTLTETPAFVAPPPPRPKRRQVRRRRAVGPPPATFEPIVPPAPAPVAEPAPSSAEPTAAELAALGFAGPTSGETTATPIAFESPLVAATAEVSADAFVPAVSHVPAAADVEHEDGPDPNHGEPDDGKPLDWRAQPRPRRGHPEAAAGAVLTASAFFSRASEHSA